MISTFGNRKCSDSSCRVSKKNFQPSYIQENRSKMVQESPKNQCKAILHDRVKSAKIVALQRRFSSCGNLGRQAETCETYVDIHSCNQPTSASSSIVKTPHFVSSLYHPVEQNALPAANSKLVHSSSVETPATSFSNTRLRSGSCPQVWTPMRLTLHNNNGSFINSMGHHNSPSIKSEIKYPTPNDRKNSIPCIEMFHMINFLHEKSKETGVDCKVLTSKRSGLSISFGSTDSSLALEKSENMYSDPYSSYEDLQEELQDTDGMSPNTPTLSSDDYESHSFLKRTVSTECFNLPRNNFILKSDSNNSPVHIGFQNFIKNSCSSNTDIYNLKSPVETKQQFVKLQSEASYLNESKNARKIQDLTSFRFRKGPTLIKTVSEQHLSSLQKSLHTPNEINGGMSISHSIPVFDKNVFNACNKNSIYVSSVFLNLSNSQSQKHCHSNKSRVSSTSPPVGEKQNSFSRRPSTLCLNQISSKANDISQLPTTTPTFCKTKHTTSTINVLKSQKESFQKLLNCVKEATFQRDTLKIEVNQMETALVQSRQLLNRPKPLCIQELKRNNFALKSEILRLTQYLEASSPKITYKEDGGDEDDHFDFSGNQKWSYNPSYDGKY